MFKLVSSTEVYRNPWIKVREDKVIRPDGKDGIFGVVDMTDGVTVLCFDSEGMSAITQEFKYGIQTSSLELISGAIDGAETPLNAAKRELKEEVGGVSNEWIYLGYINPFTTVINSKNHLFVALDTTFEEPSPDEGEVIHIMRISIENLNSLILNNSINHGASVVTFLKTMALVITGNDTNANIDKLCKIFEPILGLKK